MMCVTGRIYLAGGRRKGKKTGNESEKRKRADNNR